MRHRPQSFEKLETLLPLTACVKMTILLTVMCGKLLCYTSVVETYLHGSKALDKGIQNAYFYTTKIHLYTHVNSISLFIEKDFKWTQQNITICCFLSSRSLKLTLIISAISFPPRIYVRSHTRTHVRAVVLFCFFPLSQSQHHSIRQCPCDGISL